MAAQTDSQFILCSGKSSNVTAVPKSLRLVNAYALFAAGHVFKLDLTGLDVDALVDAWPSLEQEQERALEVFRGFPAPKLGYVQISQKYGEKAAVRAELSRLKAEWPALKERLQGQVYSFAKMQELFRIAGAPYETEHIGVSHAQLRDMFPKVQLLRARYNLLDLAMRGGFYDAIVEPVFAQGGPWEV